MHFFGLNTSEREMEIQIKDDTKNGDPYGMALKKNWRGFLEYFDGKSIQYLLNYRTVSKDSAFHIAAASGNYKLLKILLDKIPKESLVGALIEKDTHGNTALHEVATTDCVEAASELVEIILKWSDNDAQKKLMIRNKLGETPVFRAAVLGQFKMLKYFDERVGTNLDHFHRYDETSVLHLAVVAQHFDVAIWLLSKDMQLANKIMPSSTESGLTALQLLALMPSAFKSPTPMSIWKKLFYSYMPECLDDDDIYIYKEDLEIGKNYNRDHHPKKQSAISNMYIAIWMHVIEGCSAMKKIWKLKQKHKNAAKLVKLLVKEDKSWKKETDTEEEPKFSLGLGSGSMNKETKLVDATLEELVEEYNSSQTKKKARDHEDSTTETKSSVTEIPIFLAASNGVTEIFDEILDKHPEAIDFINDKGQNVLHVAIMHRQDKILESIKKLEMAVPKLGSRIDNNGYTLLHHVADMELYRGGTQAGPAFQFTEELEWFHRVKHLMPPYYVMHRTNTRKITARDLFDETHADQYKKAQVWVKEIAQSCSTISVLVATVVFAAAYTVPGGTGNQGLPILLHLPLFYVFSIMDVVSLALSLSSVVMFLSVLTSPFEPADFLLSLPRKITWGFAFLFLSVMTSMITFSASLLLIIRLEKKWTAILYAVTFFPVVVLALMQFPLYAAFLGNLMNQYVKLKKIFFRKQQSEGEMV